MDKINSFWRSLPTFKPFPVKTLLLLSCLFFSFIAQSQSDYIQSIRSWQAELNTTFTDTENSPLTKKEIKKFERLEFYEIEKKYRVKAFLRRTPHERPFTMPTTTEQQPVYVQFGEAVFELDSQQWVLPLYQNLQLRETDEYEDYLFAPFTDLTCGYESYGGGRYLDLKVPEGDSLIIDFNKAYNPSCAYNAQSSCPIPPRENDLALEIRAGVKAWDQ